MKQHFSEAERFDAGAQKILSVSHDELKRREEQRKRDRATKPKPGPKPRQAKRPRERGFDQESCAIDFQISQRL